MSVFLALLLTLFLGVTGVLLDYARAQMLSWQAEAAVSAAAESVFAGYFAPMWEEYEIFGRQIPEGSFKRLSEETLAYAGEWGGGSQADFMRFGEAEGEWDLPVFLTDEHGAVFREMAEEAVKGDGGEILISEWKRRLSLKSGTSGVLRQAAAEEDVQSEEILPGYEEVQETLDEAAGAEEEASQEGDMQEGGEEENDSETVSERDPEKEALVWNLLDEMRRIVRSGFLAALLPEGKKISDARIPAGALPSALSEEEKGRQVREKTGGSNAVLFREYLMRRMTCFTTESGKSPGYELEYLIAGKKTDEENLSAAAAKLVWMRTGMNLLYLIKSPQKRTAAREAALAAVGWVGQPALTELTAKLLMSAWALAEALGDVRTLFGGGCVAMQKTDDSWRLSLEHAAENWKDSHEERDGLSYADYLRICLYFQGQETLSYRAMDVIQWNMQMMDPDFQMSFCLVEGRFTLRVSGRLQFGFLYRRMAAGGNPALWYEKQAFFSYLEDSSGST